MRSHAAHEERWCCTCWRWIVYEFLASLDLCWHLSPLFWLQQAAGSRQAAGKQQASSKQVSSRSKKGICKLFLFLVVGMQCCDRAFAALQCRENFSVCLFLLSYYCVSLSSSLLLLTSTVTYKLSQILNVGLFMTRELTEVCRQQFLRKSSKKAHKNYYSDYCVLHKIEGQWREGR